ncbi:MAG: hypothetical protein ACOVNU_03165 [Candidatus Kapaibacteriota bacterium]
MKNMNNLKIPYKLYNPNSRSSQMQKGFISPELKVARFFGASIFDYDYSQNETDNILTYQINIQNDEDLLYINYRLKELYNTWIGGTLKNNYIFISIYRVDTDNKPQTIYYFLANNLYDINNEMIGIDLNYLYYLNTPAILTINVVYINDYTSGLEDDNWLKQRLLLETNLIDYLYNELYSKDNQNIVNLEYHPRKNIFTFVDNYKKYNVFTKYYKMLKYYLYRLNYSYKNGK